jgi:hypothetical protein
MFLDIINEKHVFFLLKVYQSIIKLTYYSFHSTYLFIIIKYGMID